MIKADVVIVGAGAAGYFSAINLAELRPDLDIILLEKSNQVLGKVKISGGGRCNVTHACFEPKELVKYYPRGGRELLGSFFTFQPKDTIQWFEDRAVKLKTEEDGRMFPQSDDSQEIINCFEVALQKTKVHLRMKDGLLNMEADNDKWLLETQKGEITASQVIFSSGSSSKVWSLIGKIGHQLIPPVPSLFTFHVNHKAVHDLAGLSLPHVQVSLKGKKTKTDGALLFTHWGLSAPSILKLSAAEAIYFNEVDYRFEIEIDFLVKNTADEVNQQLEEFKLGNTKNILNSNPFELPKRLWHYFINEAEIETTRIWSELRKKERVTLAKELKQKTYSITGKSTFKEEFVTAGGVSLKEINFKTMESKLFPGIYFSGEVLNIDGYTGGFNFQAAWTTSFIAAQAISKKV